jgi:hypothetical protein
LLNGSRIALVGCDGCTFLGYFLVTARDVAMKKRSHTIKLARPKIVRLYSNFSEIQLLENPDYNPPTWLTIASLATPQMVKPICYLFMGFPATASMVANWHGWIANLCVPQFAMRSYIHSILLLLFAIEKIGTRKILSFPLHRKMQWN